MNPLKPQQQRRRQGDSALDLVESAVHLLRESPVSVHLLYHLSSAPFVLALLWFWSDMTRACASPAQRRAQRHLPPEAGGGGAS